jgi:hypothetical protein
LGVHSDTGKSRGATRRKRPGGATTATTTATKRAGATTTTKKKRGSGGDGLSSAAPKAMHHHHFPHDDHDSLVGASILGVGADVGHHRPLASAGLLGVGADVGHHRPLASAGLLGVGADVGYHRPLASGSLLGVSADVGRHRHPEPSLLGASVLGAGAGHDPAVAGVNAVGVSADVGREGDDSVFGLSVLGVGGGRDPAVAGVNVLGVDATVLGPLECTETNTRELRGDSYFTGAHEEFDRNRWKDPCQPQLVPGPARDPEMRWRQARAESSMMENRYNSNSGLGRRAHTGAHPEHKSDEDKESKEDGPAMTLVPEADDGGGDEPRASKPPPEPVEVTDYRVRRAVGKDPSCRAALSAKDWERLRAFADRGSSYVRSAARALRRKRMETTRQQLEAFREVYVPTADVRWRETYGYGHLPPRMLERESYTRTSVLLAD